MASPHIWGISLPDRRTWIRAPALAGADMVPLLLLPLLLGGEWASGGGLGTGGRGWSPG